jgi:hypothetical protein
MVPYNLNKQKMLIELVVKHNQQLNQLLHFERLVMKMMNMLTPDLVVL